MTTEIFTQWFNNFTKQVTERPLLVIYDGHLTHVSLDIIERAIEEDITIIKLPLHVTDKLQPLDVCCFGPLKRMWEHKLNERINLFGPKENITKSGFVDCISEVWHECLTKKNIISGFRTTGIYPVDRSKYPTERLDQRLLKRYQNWTEMGKPEDLEEELINSKETPSKVRPQNAREKTIPSDGNDI